MGTNRFISTSFWDDSWIQTLDPSEKFLYLYLLTNPLTNLAGVYKITIRRICFDTGYNEDTVKRILVRFAQCGKAYLVGEWMVLPTFPKNQALASPKVFSGIQRMLETLPYEILAFLPYAAYTMDTREACARLGLSYPLSVTHEFAEKFLRDYLRSELDLASQLGMDTKPLPFAYVPPETQGNTERTEENNAGVGYGTDNDFALDGGDNTGDFGAETPAPKPEEDTSGKKKKAASGRFSKPTVEEVDAYIREKGYTFGAVEFWNFYESKGWKVGNTPMKSWRAACVTWQSRQRDWSPQRIQNDRVTRESLSAFEGMADSLEGFGT